ncbi:hypothetical protein ES288_A11G256200v1 [Gossypium darwinii]|uniref:Protein artemis n=1 Tax=Gossypium darwinii TaxID=34276 RepID=A0A5D2EPX1_GOSDA|nr:hypothetical protein ES288_A11G256200v1 [Gossypium darwinii]
MEKGLISVDRWAEGSQAYFLTNLHTDHTQGAVMFLFRGEFGCMLNTGDFRWEKNCERAKLAKEMLLNALKDDAVDVLYLDNTYCNPTFQFPTREVAAKQVADIISSHPDHDIVVGIDTLGKEDLLLHISNALNVKIWVWPERLQTMHILGFHDIFTTDTSLTRVRAIPRYSFSINTLEGLNRMHPTIGIIPSGLPWVVKPFEGNGKLFDSLLTSGYNRSKVSSEGGKQNDKSNGNLESVKRFHKYVYSVQYSGHSSYLEIEEFIKLVQPTSMKGIVSSSSCNVDPFYYFGRICGINQPSQKLDNEHQTFGRGGYTGIEKKRKRVGRLGFYLSRVTVMRRGRKGIKLDEN